MTRKDAIKKIDENRGGDFWTKSQVLADFAIDIIDEIYDNFESRMCKTCKYYAEEESVCTNEKKMKNNTGGKQ